MKTHYSPTLLFVFLAFTSCAEDPAQLTFRVIDDAGNPVTNSTVEATTFVRWVRGGTEAGEREYDRREAKTDTNGVASILIPSKTGTIDYWVKATGGNGNTSRILLGDGREYYYDEGGSFRFTNVVNGKWQPWNPTVEVEVKAVLNPIPMYSRPLGPFDLPTCKTPELGREFAFDLMASDWIAPFGKGKVADFLIRVDSKPSVMPAGFYEENPRAKRRMDSSLSVSFSNPDDGIQPVFAEPLKGSTFRLPRFAPERGYLTNYAARHYAESGTGRFIDETDRPDQNFFFRVRSRRDDKGNLVGALYGKILGPIKFSSDGRLEFEYYLNPTPVDRNMEFDPKRNLLRP